MVEAYIKTKKEKNFKKDWIFHKCVFINSNETQADR